MSLVRKQAPSFKATAVMPDLEFKTVSLDDFNGKYLLIFFYPLDFTFVCPTEIISFNDASSEFEKLGCSLLGVSVDSQFSHLAWIKEEKKMEV